MSFCERDSLDKQFTSKRLQKTQRALLSNVPFFHTGTVVDAVGLYARYISLDADQPIGIPSHIRNQVEG